MLATLAVACSDEFPDVTAGPDPTSSTTVVVATTPPPPSGRTTPDGRAVIECGPLTVDDIAGAVGVAVDEVHLAPESPCTFETGVWAISSQDRGPAPTPSPDRLSWMRPGAVSGVEGTAVLYSGVDRAHRFSAEGLMWRGGRHYVVDVTNLTPGGETAPPVDGRTQQQRTDDVATALVRAMDARL